MSPLLLLPYYFAWHYSQGLTDLIGLIKNFIWFFWHFFSIPGLFRTLFQPWQRLHEESKRGASFGDLMTVWLINILMKLAGALIRLTFVMMGFVFSAATIVIGIAATVFWIALPLCLIVFILLGVFLLIKPL